MTDTPSSYLQGMRKCVFLFGFLFVTAVAFAQKSHDAALDRRVNEYFTLTRAMDVDRLMEYTHPRIFDVVPKDQLITIIKQSYNNESFDISIDSIAVISYSKPFIDEKIQYVRIDYAMKMLMKFKDSSLFDNPQFPQMVMDNAKTSFPTAVISLDASKRTFVFNMTSIAVGLKDPAQKSWLFLGYQNNELVDKIFSPAVRKNLQLQ